MPQKQTLAVKLGPWLQFVGLMLVFAGLLASARQQDWGHVLAYTSLAVSVAGFVIARLNYGTRVDIRFVLQLIGFGLAVAGISVLESKLLVGLVLAYLGVGTNFAGLFYDALYP